MTRTSCSFLLVSEPAWFPPCSPRARRIPMRAQHWLAESGSLTTRLRILAGPVQVQVLYQGWGRPFPNEARRLQVPRGQRIWIREICLQGAGQPLLLARTVAPAVTLTGPGSGFTRLGTRPLGELLFTHPGVERVGVDWACLDSANWRLVSAARPRWGRRTFYRVGRGRPLLVSEFFLPAVFVLEAGDALA